MPAMNMELEPFSTKTTEAVGEVCTGTVPKIAIWKRKVVSTTPAWKGENWGTKVRRQDGGSYHSTDLFGAAGPGFQLESVDPLRQWA
jgi:hypothetical protein